MSRPSPSRNFENSLEKRSEDRVVTWSRSSDVSFGCNEWASIQDSIEECDHFLVILSDDAPDSILVPATNSEWHCDFAVKDMTSILP